MKIRCVVACHNAHGSPDFFPFVADVSPVEFEEGLHYQQWQDAARDNGYEAPFTVYDEDDGPRWLFDNLFSK